MRRHQRVQYKSDTLKPLNLQPNKFISEAQWDLKRFSWAKVWKHYQILVMKLLYDPDIPLNELDRTFIVLAREYLDSVQNPDFVLYKKLSFRKVNESVIDYYLRSIRNGAYPDKHLTTTLKASQVLLIKRGHIQDPREYFGNFKKVSCSKSLLTRINFNISRKQRKQFVGVGYRDKGNKRHPEIDGNLPWQEIYPLTGNYRKFPDKYYSLEFILNNFGTYYQGPIDGAKDVHDLIDQILQDSD